MASLIGFHRVLIGFAILFCLVYAGWELLSWWVRGSGSSLALGIVFLVLAAALGFYLARLRTFVGYRDEPPRSDRPGS